MTRVLRTWLVGLLTGAVVGLTPAVAAGEPDGAPTAGPVAAAVSTDLTFVGHGWGHGRGMGQYGALGYAVDHGWTYDRILAHYYSNTTMASAGIFEMTVELTGQTGKPLVVTGSQVLLNNSPTGAAALRLELVPNSSTVQVSTGPGCTGPWTPYTTSAANATRVSMSLAPSIENLLRVCEPTTERAYRGSLSVINHNGTQMAINHLPTEEYLRGVVPRESPASWGALGNGRGMEALKAQSVAARSYAMSSSRPTGAKTCDTTACQVYGGAGTLTGTTWTVLEDVRTDQAIAATAGQVRLLNGAVARTEFSSSTGGYSAGGVFPAVPDAGDSIAANPNHVWTASFSAADVAARLTIPGLRSITVTGRNGLGDWGGRVTEVVVVDGTGVSHRMTASALRSALGTDRLKSDWFAVSYLSVDTAESVVSALYQDLLGRAPDPTGLEGWSAALLTGTGQPVLVDTLTRSDEYIALRVAKAYREVLGREPEPAGAAAWLSAIRSRQATVDDVQRRFYDSAEYLAISGGTYDGYLRRLYTTMLRRPASDAEVTAWLAFLNAHGRSATVDAIWFSLEAAKIRAGDYYQTFLGRAADPTGLDAWARVLLSHGEGAVRNGIAGSEEYRARAVVRFP